MTSDMFFTKLSWSKVFQQIQDPIITDSRPVLVLRSDELESVNEIKKSLNSSEKVIHVRLGVVCSMAWIYQEILQQINGTCTASLYHHVTIKQIVRSIDKKNLQLVVVVDNCQHLVCRQCFVLLGLVLKLVGKVQFVFLLPDDYAKKWLEQLRGYRGEVFLNFISLKFDITKSNSKITWTNN